MKRSIKWLARRFVKKAKIGFWKKPVEYFLLAAVIAAIVIKYRNPIQDIVFDRASMGSEEFIISIMTMLNHILGRDKYGKHYS